MNGPLLAAKMRHFFGRSGKSQKEIARALRVSNGAVSRWLSGGRITLGNLDGFARQCGVDLSTLLNKRVRG
jgi:transcriptional regulator with XRE-family HTH domain